MATSKRARQIISGDEPLVGSAGKKPLSVAVEELNQGKIKILAEDEVMEEQEVYDRTDTAAPDFQTAVLDNTEVEEETPADIEAEAQQAEEQEA